MRKTLSSLMLFTHETDITGLLSNDAYSLSSLTGMLIRDTELINGDFNQWDRHTELINRAVNHCDRHTELINRAVNQRDRHIQFNNMPLWPSGQNITCVNMAVLSSSPYAWWINCRSSISGSGAVIVCSLAGGIPTVTYTNTQPLVKLTELIFSICFLFTHNISTQEQKSGLLWYNTIQS